MSDSAPVCCQCGRPVSPDEVAITKKLINRGTASYFCIPCLAAYFNVGTDVIVERIAYFRAMGCTLFSASKENMDQQ